MNLDLTQVILAIITGVVSITVARITAGNKAEKTAKETTHNIVNNGFGTEIRNKMAEMQSLIDSMAERLNGYTVIRLERDEFRNDVVMLEREINGCSVVDCPLKAARKQNNE